MSIASAAMSAAQPPAERIPRMSYSVLEPSSVGHVAKRTRKRQVIPRRALFGGCTRPMLLSITTTEAGEDIMRTSVGVLLLALAPVMALAAEFPDWAYPVAPPNLPRLDPNKIITVPGSDK